MINIKLNKGKSIYFSSDNHLGAPNYSDSLIREKLFISWLDKIKKDAQVIFLLGDLFDFWFEYYKSVPKGFTRILGEFLLRFSMLFIGTISQFTLKILFCSSIKL